MYQPWLLLVELGVLGVTIYFFWLTRQAAQRNRAEILEDVQKMVREYTSAQNDAMTRNVAALVQEMESTAAEMRAQWTRQSIELQDALRRAEETEAKVHSMLANTAVSAVPAATIVHTDSPAAAENTLGAALEEYYRHLLDAGRTPDSAGRMVGHVKGFARWWGGQRYERVQLRPINPAEVEAYSEVLHGENLKVATIRRKLNAVKDFLAWLNHRSPSAEPVKVSAPVKSTPQTERRAVVQMLAQQGLDIRTIAARTGMEQETVRILLRDDV